MVGRGPDMQDSLGLMQFHDHQYLYSSSGMPLQQPLLSQRHRFLEANEGCTGEDDVPEFVEPVAVAGTMVQRQELGVCKEVYSEEGGHGGGRAGGGGGGSSGCQDDRGADGVRGTPLYAVSAWTWCPPPHARA